MRRLFVEGQEDLYVISALERTLAGLGPELKKFEEIHAHKARLRTWLAWSSTPDLVSGAAVRAYFGSRQLEGLEPLRAWLQRAFGEVSAS